MPRFSWRQGASDLDDFSSKIVVSHISLGTIILEHLLQAADISHCMQNWNVYLKWNERLFDENYEVCSAYTKVDCTFLLACLMM